MIAGNGRFPILALKAAREQGDEVVAIGIEGEASPEIEQLAAKCYWISLGALSRLVEILKQEGIREVLFAGQVKHVSIFSTIRPDWRLAKLLLSLERRNTASLIGGVIQVLEEEGIQIADSTRLLKPLLAPEGVLTRRAPDESEQADLAYGSEIAHALARFDIGQSVAIAERACVAVEAMEGTDAMLQRAASLAKGRALRLVKSSAGRKHLLFDVPVVGPQTIAVMKETGTTAMAVDAGRTLLLDRDEMLKAADRAGIAVLGVKPAE